MNLLFHSATLALLVYVAGTLALIALLAWTVRYVIRANREAEQHFRAIEAERMHVREQVTATEQEIDRGIRRGRRYGMIRKTMPGDGKGQA